LSTSLLRGGMVHAPVDAGATALLVEDDRVAWVGTDAVAESYADGADEVVDLGGALVTPAFVDAHVHATSTGLALDGLDLSTTRSLGEALDAVAAYVRRLTSGTSVVLGHGWDESGWPEARPPTHAELDRATGGRPVYLTRIDVHSAIVSPALLASTPDVAGLDGYHPEGALSREAHHAVRATALAAVTPAQRDAAQRSMLTRAASLGIAAVHECAGPKISGLDDLAALLRLAAVMPSPLVTAYWGELASSGGVVRALSVGAAGAAGDLFVDGALGSHTACLRETYVDAKTLGAAYLSVEEVTDHVSACARAGLQAGFHAIGDAALHTVVEGFEAAALVVGLDVIRAGRHRIEHAEMLDADLVTRLALLDLTASVQPIFDALWGGEEGMYAARLGVARAATLNPFGALVARRVRLAFGSDAPVTPLGGWEAVRAAAYHRTAGHEVDAATAFTAHTVGGWQAAGVDDAGLLVRGAPAHLAVWDAPGFPDLAGPTPRCLRTVVGGRVVYDAGAF
jgi:predicted amidohydrolase YtcJ